MITRHLQTVLGKMLEEPGIGENCPLTSGARSAHALSLIHIVRLYQLKLDQKFMSSLCKALLLRPDYEKQRSADYEELLQHFPTMKDK